MIEVSDAQVAPISPSSRFSPTSAGAAVVAAASVLLLIPDPFSDRAPQGGCHPRVGSREMQVSDAYALSENIVETRPISEKWPIGVVSVTRVTGSCPPVNAPCTSGPSLVCRCPLVSELPTRDYRPMSAAFQ